MHHNHSSLYICNKRLSTKIEKTGSNNGIGFAIVEELLRKGVGTVYLTARNDQRGKDAIEKLKEKGLQPEYHQLEVSDETSVKVCADYIKAKHGGLDILINNAGVTVADLHNTTYEDAKRVLNTNYNSILTVEKYFYPILNENARVINVSSNCGHISNIKNKEWISRLTKDDITRADVDAFVTWFLDSVNNGTWKAEDFVQTPMLAYRVSKVALSALTKVQQKEIGRNISINSLHPGFVKTAMTKWQGDLTMEESSKSPAYLALDADQRLKGKYIWFDKTEKVWEDASLPLYCDFYKIQNNLLNNRK